VPEQVPEQVPERPLGRGLQRAPMRVRREMLLHGALAALSAGAALALVGTFVAGLLWRAAALSLALTLVIVAMARAVRLGRAEWRHEPPSRQDYRRVIGRFALAFLLVVVASS
jgi:hypothetical protein